MTGFELPFMRTALIAGLLAGNALAVLGAFILLRGVAFSGLAVSQLAALGTVVGAVLGLHLGGFAAAFAFAAAGLLLFDRLGRRWPGPPDAWVACVYLLAASGALLVLAKAQHGESHTMTIFFGNLLALGETEVLEAAGICAASLLVLVPWFHRWVWLSFDPLAAAVAGVKVERWTALFLMLFAAAMTVAIHLFGVLLAFSFLLLPAATGLVWSRRLAHLFWFVPVMTTLSVWAGLRVSLSSWDFPPSPLIACLMALILLTSGAAKALFGRG